MSPHTKALVFAALACHVAVSAMVFIAANPDWTPTFAVILDPYAWGLSALATASYALDLVLGFERPRQRRNRRA
jgi:hypothetical protein